jgi:cation transport regulator ChaB
MNASNLIPIPDDLRARLEAWEPNLRARMADRQQRLDAINTEISDLEKIHSEITKDVAQLRRSSVVLSEDAAHKIAAKEIRLKSVNDHLATLHAKREAEPAIALEDVGSLMAEIGRHWLDEFPKAFAQAIAPFEPLEHRRIELARLSSAFGVQRAIINWSWYKLTACDADIARVTGIFQRALEGRPYIGE